MHVLSPCRNRDCLDLPKGSSHCALCRTSSHEIIHLASLRLFPLFHVAIILGFFLFQDLTIFISDSFLLLWFPPPAHPTFNHHSILCFLSMLSSHTLPALQIPWPNLWSTFSCNTSSQSITSKYLPAKQCQQSRSQ